ncbi:unnamed protein product [Polarella glacialis]|uniref:Uncharacterized protein n=1 Tax=Polarella glacialis TaxID=89957 RepID=A0A813HG20_POLGL|nr:unnamed protein product [Polarella glacialis]
MDFRLGLAGASWAVFVSTLLHSSVVSAWGPVGHERLNRIAQSLLHGKHRDQIRTMMHADVIDVASWEKTMTSRFPETDVLHWHHQNPEWSCSDPGVERTDHIRCDSHGAESGSLFCALAYFFDHFADEMLLKEYPKPKTPIDTPKKLDVLDKVDLDSLYENSTSANRQNMKPAHYLRWLTELLGDLHQPLHWLRGTHDYGKSVSLQHNGTEYTLLSFWEDFLPNNLPALPAVSELDLEYNAVYHSWGQRLPTELFREWAGELSAKVCQEIYAPMYINHADGSRDIERPFQVSEELFQKWRTTATKLIQEGGERLALVYLDILEHKRHKAAHKEGRGIAPPMSSGSLPKMLDSRQSLLAGLHVARRKRAWHNLGINSLLAMLVVPSVLFGLQAHARNGHKVRLWKKDNN